MRLRIAMSSSVALGTLILAAPAEASCAPPIPLRRAVAESPAVFVGTVVETAAGGRAATVEVEEVWKGEVGSRMTVHGGEIRSGVISSVDRTYTRGGRYLFVPYEISAAGIALDNACTRTAPYKAKMARFAPETTREITTGSAPGDEDPASPGGINTVILIGGAAAAGLTLLLLLRRSVARSSA